MSDLAYSLWKARGRPLGDDWTDWFAAEARLRSVGSLTSEPMPAIRCDFMRDLRALYATKLADAGVYVDSTIATGEVLAKYFALWHRAIGLTPRRVEWSKELRARASALTSERQQALAKIDSAARAGADLNPYQSRHLVTKRGAADGQLLEWGITHFHLGLKPDTKHPTLIEGTPDLLFVVVRPNALYMIEIFDHKSFADDQVFNVALANWPELFEHARWIGAVGLERPVSAEERAMLRRANINLPTLGEDGAVYGAVQLGVTTAGTPVAVMQQHVIPIVKHVQALQRWCLEQPSAALAHVPVLEVLSSRSRPRSCSLPRNNPRTWG